MMIQIAPWSLVPAGLPLPPRLPLLAFICYKAMLTLQWIVAFCYSSYTKSIPSQKPEVSEGVIVARDKEKQEGIVAGRLHILLTPVGLDDLGFARGKKGWFPPGWRV